MNSLDFVVFVIYLIGLVLMGGIFSRMKNTSEMFAAGGRSPWWLSGLSAFMTTFSAGTFVIWGGISYQFGMVGVSILMVIGVASIFVGWFLASRWKKLGYESAAAFLDDRFGKSIVQFYTWLQGVVGIFTMGGAIYALAIIVTALIPLPAEHFLADSETGHFSVTIASLLICALVILITFSGGLWAVLMTDALQFIILTISVLIVVPLILIHVGGPSEFIASAPEGFLSPVANEFTWYFLVGWGIVFFFKMGGEWAYIQRFVCVPSGKDAKKSSYLFGFLYIISPIIWMLPPMAYRLVNPNANYEQAYILACQAVLPAGMLGLMIAAMCSATASMVTTQLNVFAGAFTTEFYQQLFRPKADEKELVFAGRIITLLLGGIAIAGALLIPLLGTYTEYILASVAILTGPLVLPTIWGLFSRKIGLGTAWLVTVLGIAIGLIAKFGFASGGWFEEIEVFMPLQELMQINGRVTEIVIGTFVPLLILAITEVSAKQTDEGWKKVIAHKDINLHQEPVLPSSLPARLCGWSILIISVMMGVIAMATEKDFYTIAIFALILLVLGSIILFVAKNVNKRQSILLENKSMNVKD